MLSTHSARHAGSKPLLPSSSGPKLGSAPEMNFSWRRLCRTIFPEISTHVAPPSQITSDLCQAGAAIAQRWCLKEQCHRSCRVLELQHQLVRAHTQQGSFGAEDVQQPSLFARFAGLYFTCTGSSRLRGPGTAISRPHC